MSSITFDLETCGRCGGTGRMPFAVWGGRCFGCSGRGKRATRAGANAFRKWDAFKGPRVAVDVEDLRVGDVVRASVTSPNGATARWWARVEEIGEPQEYGYSAVDGVKTPLVGRNVRLSGPPGRPELAYTTIGARSFEKRVTRQDIADFAAAHPRLKGYTITITEEEDK